MTRKRRLSHADAEALLTRRSEEHPEVAAIVAALSSGWSGPTDERTTPMNIDRSGLAEDRGAMFGAGWSGPTEDRGAMLDSGWSGPEDGERHLTAIHEAAKLHAHDRGPAHRASSLGSASGHSRRRVFLDRSKAFAFKLSSSVVALSAATMGLAHAGVDLPGKAAEKAFSAVGIELPNQNSDSGKSVADDVKAAKEGLEPGCERGQAVAAAASQNSKSKSKERPTPCDNGKGGDHRATSGAEKAGQDRSSKGRSKASSAKGKDKGKEVRGPAKERPEAPERSKGSQRANPGKGKATGQNRKGSSDENGLDTLEEVVEPSSNIGLGNAKGNAKKQ